MRDLPTSSDLPDLVPYLTPQELDEIEKLMGASPVWMPLPRSPQQQAFHSEANELFFGGAAGGGKTDLLIGLAITQAKKSVIFRREFTQLKDVVQRSREILNDTDAKYNGQLATWRDIPGNRTLEFGAVQYERDVNKYKGRPHDLKAFDELPEFTEAQYRFLIGWARTTDPNQRVRVVGTGNPPTRAEGEWVIRYWGPWLDDQHDNPAEPGELRWFAVIDGENEEREDGEPFEYKGETIRPKSRTFIPALLTDNPYLMATDYGTVLQNLPEPLRSQLLYGDFSLDHDDDPWQVIPTDWVRQAQARWRPNGMPRDDEGELLSMSALGVDVARGGKDQTVLCPRYHNWFGELQKHPGSSTPDGPSAVTLLATAVGMNTETPLHIDVIGIGSSVYDTGLSQGLSAVGVNFAEGTTATNKSGKLKFRNVRAEAYWRLREALDPNDGDDLALPPDNELLADLVSPHWKMTASGIQVESKEDIKKRLHRSTDCGDAVVLANFIPSTFMIGFAG